MTTRTASTAARDPGSVVAMLIVMLAVPLTISVAHAHATEDSSRTGDDAAVRQVVAGCGGGGSVRKHEVNLMTVDIGGETVPGRIGCEASARQSGQRAECG